MSERTIDITADDKPEKLDVHDRKQMQEAFGEDISLRRTGNSTTTEYIAKEKPLKPRGVHTPNNLETGGKIMRIATGQGRRIFDNPLQLAISAQGFEQWCIDKNITPSFAGLSYYLGISKDTLIKYTRDRTEYLCYSIRDTISGEYIYSTNDRHKLELYIERNNIVDIPNNKVNIPEHKESNITKAVSKSMQQKIDDGEFEVVAATTTFADTLAPIKNLLEIVNINNAEHAKNAGWQIFLAKNNFGITDHYADEQQIAIKASNPMDDMTDAQILGLTQSLPDDESGIDDDESDK
jgi:hypothetical protein